MKAGIYIYIIYIYPDIYSVFRSVTGTGQLVKENRAYAMLMHNYASSSGILLVTA